MPPKADGDATSEAAQPPPVPLAPGFRFHPTDEELVAYYLRRRVLGQRLRLDAIAEVELYKHEPWKLPSMSRLRSRDMEWYFFSPLDRKLAGAGAGGRGGSSATGRLNRATKDGYWKTTGKDREVWHRGRIAGMKKTLVYHNGRAPKGLRTNWVMHEYRLVDGDGENEKNASSVARQVQDMIVVCRIFQKKGAGPMNGAQYGAPLVEDEWEEEETVEGVAATAAVTMMADIGEGEYYSSDENELLQLGDFPRNLTLASTAEPAVSTDTALLDSDNRSFGKSFDEIKSEPAPEYHTDEAVVNASSSSDCSEVHIPDQNCQQSSPDALYLNPAPVSVSSSWLIRETSKQNVHNEVEKEQNLQKLLGVEEFFSMQWKDEPDTSELMSDSQINSVPNSSYLQSTDFSIPLTVDALGMPSDDDWAMYSEGVIENYLDAEDSFVALDRFLYSPRDCSAVPNGDDDYMAYFDAKESENKNDGIVESDMKSNLYETVSTKFSEEVIGTQGEAKSSALYYGASSSSQSSGDADNAAYPSTMPGEHGSKKPVESPLVGMLGSIYAPSVLAEEFPRAAAKGRELAGSPIHVTAGLIEIGGVTWTGGLQKSTGINFLFSICVSSGMILDDDGGYEPTTKELLVAVSVAMRGGFYLLLVSTMILALAYKLGSCVLGSVQEGIPMQPDVIEAKFEMQNFGSVISGYGSANSIGLFS